MALLPLALVVAVLAALWTFLTVGEGAMIPVMAWPAFIGWAFFFVGGGDTKAIMKAGLPLASGVILAWAAVTASASMGAYGLPIAVGIIAGLMVLMGNQALFALIPAQFVGAAVFVGVLVGGTAAPLVPSLISLACGLALGITSVTIPGLIAKKDPKAAPAAAA